jgi:hypothetical protein
VLFRIAGLRTALVAIIAASSAVACLCSGVVACTPPERCFDAVCATGAGAAGEVGGAGGVSSSSSSAGGGAGGAPDGAVCGDGRKDAEEACDALDLGGTTCVDLRYFGGTLACLASCQLDELPCAKTCGNAAVDQGEACDGTTFGGATCQTLLPMSPGGELACDAACSKLDASGCSAPPSCGTGVVDAGEQCDGLDLGGQSCRSRGYASGDLACNANCSFDESACTRCGNGTIDPGEICDGANLNGETCQSRGFAAGGSPLCAAACTSFNTAVCDPCGNGVVNNQEACDGEALGGATCQSLGFDAGTLACNASCTFDTGGCNN